MDVIMNEHSTLNFTEETIHSKIVIDTKDEVLLNRLKKYITDLH